MALTADGRAIAWGDNFYGQTNVPSGLSNVVAIAAGGRHSLALKSDGTVIGWGLDGSGQVSPPPGLSNVIAIAGGESHSLALIRDGTVVAWGWNQYGQTNIPTEATNVVLIATKGDHNLALRGDGTVVAWGKNTDENGDLLGQTNVPPGLKDVLAIAAGKLHSVALVGPPGMPLRLFNPVWTGSAFSLLAPSLPGKYLVLEFNDSVTATNWASLPDVRGNGATAILKDTSAYGGWRFYRVRRE